MASSGATELSQESDRLRSSYFTHHLVSALRGAGDSDRDGQVTLSEAYHYAYHRTLVDTASTAVGTQHATLETGLRGKGEIVLTYPVRATSQLELPAALEAQVLIEREQSGTVIAELHKVKGEPLRLGLPAGQYRALVRRARELRQCRLWLADNQVSPVIADNCPRIEEQTVAFKGGTPFRKQWALELGIGGSSHVSDDYTKRLGAFGYAQNLFPAVWPVFELTLLRGLTEHLAGLVSVVHLETAEYNRSDMIASPASGGAGTVMEHQKFSWTVVGVGVGLRAAMPLWHERLIPYGQGSAGLAIGRSTLATTQGTTESDDSQTFVGYHLSLAAGLAVMPWRHTGFYGQGRATYAPVVDNLLGDTHDSGGLDVTLGVRGAW
jgi:hypothetical protein